MGMWARPGPVPCLCFVLCLSFSFVFLSFVFFSFLSFVFFLFFCRSFFSVFFFSFCFVLFLCIEVEQMQLLYGVRSAVMKSAVVATGGLNLPNPRHNTVHP